MRAGVPQRGWLFLGLMALASITLAVLQYRWTAELSRIEAERAQNTLQERTEAAAFAFDDALRNEIRQLIPTGREVASDGSLIAHHSRLEGWRQSFTGPEALPGASMPLFARIAIAIPNKHKDLDLFEARGNRFVRTEWPAEWLEFRERARTRFFEDGRPPRTPPDGKFIEVPVFGEQGELEWMLFALDFSYLKSRYFPALLTPQLNAAEYDCAVTSTAAPGQILYRCSGDTAAPLPAVAPEAEAGIFPRTLLRPPGRREGGPEAGDPRPPPREFVWKLSVWQRAGPLESALSSTRWRNLAVALLLLGFLVAAGVSLVRYNNKAREILEAERRFFATISHELRTPLAAIHAAGQTLQSGVIRDESQRERYAGIIVRQSSQLNDLVEQVLHYAAAATSFAATSSANVPLRPVLEGARDALAHDFTAAGCELRLSPSAMDFEIAGADASALRRLFQNLFSNALRHGAGGSSVDVNASRSEDGKFVEIQVRDHGPGIDPRELPRIFEPFYRGEAARSKQTRGAGIGLSLVREIALAHHGSVQAANATEGTGAVFTVRLPLRTSA